MRRLPSLGIGLSLLLALVMMPAGAAVVPVSAAAASDTFTNPIAHSDDPYIIRYQGNYYFTGTDGCQGGYLCVWKTATITGLGSATKYSVFKIPGCPAPNCADDWAPEIHYLRGRFYIYYAADAGSNSQHRIFVLEDTGSDPVGTYIEADTGYPSGELHEASDEWAIDPDVFTTTQGGMYLVWSGWPTSAGTEQDIYIAPMSDPLHLSGPRVDISAPTRPWETIGLNVNEGPVGFQHGGRTFISYSASFCATDSYSVGLLTDQGQNLLDPAAWVKTGPIFAEHSGVEGPASFVPITSPSGEDWFLVHSNTAACDPGRVIRAQRLYWDTDGMPLLGYPIADGVPIVAPAGELGSSGTPDPYVRGWGSAFGDAAEGDGTDGLQSGHWQIPGPSGARVLASPGSTSSQVFRASNPNYQTYSVAAQVSWQGGGPGDSRYGIYACYSDHLNQVQALIDPRTGEFLTDGVVQGIDAGWQSTALPAGFEAGRTHAILVRKEGATFTFSLDGSVLQQRTFTGTAPVLLSGQVGLIAENASASYEGVRVFDTV
ncbi:MAG TPA: glycoside hydrolase family 43 protein [Candidatus Dormibacteraeota bacterium]|jgi:GH43 family beta-xylosidase|nr:glycoside hydrolase family 43 protein [Candidatus Dormibacteraeota bacterium]